MRLSLYTFVAAALATLVRAGTITVKNLDEKAREIIFTSNAGSPEIETVTVPGHGSSVVQVPLGWMGNLYSVTEGAPKNPGILAEFAFDQWDDLCFFDASTIVNPTDYEGVKKVFPTADPDNVSGCDTYETLCSNAYNHPDDIQTKSSLFKDFTVNVGTSQTYHRRHARDFILGTHTNSATADAQ